MIKLWEVEEEVILCPYCSGNGKVSIPETSVVGDITTSVSQDIICNCSVCGGTGKLKKLIKYTRL